MKADREGRKARYQTWLVRQGSEPGFTTLRLSGACFGFREIQSASECRSSRIRRRRAVGVVRIGSWQSMDAEPSSSASDQGDSFYV